MGGDGGGGGRDTLDFSLTTECDHEGADADYSEVLM